MPTTKRNWNTAARDAIAVAIVATALAGAMAAVAGTTPERPPGNSPPRIGGTPPATATVSQAYSFTPTASDPDGDRLRFRIFNRPPWATFSTTTGRLSGTPGPDHIGEYIAIRIRVNDGYSYTNLPRFSITVAGQQGPPPPPANRPPVISGSPPTSAQVGQVYSFRPTASDADGNVLAFSIANRPAWATFDTANGTLAGTPGTGATGMHPNVQIGVSDGQANAALPAFGINVVQTTLGSATLTWQAPTTRVDGTSLTNLAGYRIHYGTAVNNYPNVVQIPNAGITSAVVSQLTPATWYFVVSAYDATGLESSTTSPVSKTIQ